MLLHLSLLEEAVRALEEGRRVALCAIVKTRGSTPQSPGAMMLVDQSMTSHGTIGGGCVEAEVCKRAFALLNEGRSELRSFRLDHDFGWDDGLICGGGMDVAVMPLLASADGRAISDALRDIRAGRPGRILFRVRRGDAWEEYRVLVPIEQKLLIAGAGHVGAQLAKLCVDLEFDVTVIDDRADYANAQRLPPPTRVLVGDIEQSLRGLTIDQNTYVVIVTRGHKHDEQALSAVIHSDARYLGMIGSRRKVKVIFDDLAAAGVPAEALARVHAPIGLDIHAVTVPEIAVSIAAQLISTRRAESGPVVEGPFPASLGGQAGGAS
jgi:xanthine dehydrogenase accessory factor